MQKKGWSPQHLVARDDAGIVLGVVPLYLKALVFFSLCWGIVFQTSLWTYMLSMYNLYMPYLYIQFSCLVDELL
jgi:predicted N-acyltransferase